MEREEFVRLGTAFHAGGGVFYTNGHIVRLPRPEGFDRLYLAAHPLRGPGRHFGNRPAEAIEVIDIESGFTLEGSSGSPVLNNRGEAVGIVFARRGERGGGAADRVFAVHINAMKAVCR